MSRVDSSQWPRIGGTSAGGYYEVSRDVMLAIPHPDYAQTEAGARRSMAEYERLARSRGHKHALIVAIDRVVAQDSGSRRMWAEELNPDVLCSMALVGSSMLARAIGSFFLGLRRPRVPTAMFPDLEAAIAWSREQAERHGGPLPETALQ